MEAVAQRSETKRLSLIFPSHVEEWTRVQARELNLTISEFVWRVIEKSYHEAERIKLEKQLAEGYMANYELDKKMNEEWTHANAE
ncbi:MAG: hypothetical protein WBZ48_02755 [Bacteroidota bacterium]